MSSRKCQWWSKQRNPHVLLAWMEVTEQQRMVSWTMMAVVVVEDLAFEYLEVWLLMVLMALMEVEEEVVDDDQKVWCVLEPSSYVFASSPGSFEALQHYFVS